MSRVLNSQNEELQHVINELIPMNDNEGQGHSMYERGHTTADPEDKLDGLLNTFCLGYAHPLSSSSSFSHYRVLCL